MNPDEENLCKVTVNLHYVFFDEMPEVREADGPVARFSIVKSSDGSKGLLEENLTGFFELDSLEFSTLKPVASGSSTCYLSARDARSLAEINALPPFSSVLPSTNTPVDRTSLAAFFFNTFRALSGYLSFRRR